MDRLFLVALGGGVGAVARYLLAGWMTLRGGADQERLRLLLGVGLLGGFTTFSAFSLKTLLMMMRRFA